MKQLVNRYDGRVRFTVPDARLEGKYIWFDLPTAGGNFPCMWSADDWSIAELSEDRKGECKELCDWLRARVEEKNYTAKGVSMACGRCYSWLSMILTGKYNLNPRHEPILEKALGLKKGAIARKRREILHKDSDV